MAEIEKLKVFISSKIGDKYNTIRERLAEQLRETKLFSVYVYEIATGSSHPNTEQYLFELSRSDVVIFIIDNFDENIHESIGLRNEFDKAKELQKPSLFYFCRQNDDKETAYQREVKATDFAGKYVVIDNLEEVLNIARPDLIKDIFDAYRKYSDGYYVSTNGSKPSVEKNYDTESIVNITDTSTNYVLNYFNNFIFGNNNEIIIDERNFDYYAYKFIPILFSNRDIEEYNFGMLFEEIEDIISNDHIMAIIKERWKANQKYIIDDKQKAISILKNIYNENKNNVEIPKWLLTDILIDLRNWINKYNEEINIFEPKNYAQIEIEETKKVYHPIIDRNKSSLLEWIESDRQKKDIQSIYATSYYGDFSLQISQIANIYYQAILYGSYTHLVSVFSIIQKFTYHLGIQTGDYKIQMCCLKLSVIVLNSKDLKRLSDTFSDLMSRLSVSQANEILSFSSTFYKSSIGFQNKLKAMSVFGYYLSDSDFEKYWLDIKKNIENWFEKENPNIHLESIVFSTISNICERLADNKIVEFGLNILNSSKNRFKQAAVRMLEKNVDYRLIDNDLIANLGLTLISELKEENIEFAGFARTDILFIKIMKNHYIKEIDEFLKKEYTYFYEREYFLEFLSFDNQEDINNAIDNLSIALTDRIEKNSSGKMTTTYSNSISMIIAHLILNDSNNLINVALIKQILYVAIDGLNRKLSYQHKFNLNFMLLIILINKRFIIENKKKIVELLNMSDSQLLNSEEHIALRTFNCLLLEVLESNSEKETITDLIFIKDSDAAVDVLEFLNFYNSYKEYLSLNTRVTLYNFILKCASSDVLEIRKKAVKPLLQYIEDDIFETSAKKNIEDMMINDHIEIKIIIASQIQHIYKIDAVFSERLTDIVEKNDNFLVRKVLNHFK